MGYAYLFRMYPPLSQQFVGCCAAVANHPSRLLQSREHTHGHPSKRPRTLCFGWFEQAAKCIEIMTRNHHAGMCQHMNEISIAVVDNLKQVEPCPEPPHPYRLLHHTLSYHTHTTHHV